MRDNIQLGLMKQLVEASNEDDDWTGLADSAARRKRQNRLNQRAYRRRNAQQAQTAQSQQITLWPPFQPYDGSPRSSWSQTSDIVPAHPTHPTPPSGSPVIPYINPSEPFRWQGTITFPLTADHLIILVQYNVLRATLTNMSILSVLHSLPLECGNALAIPLLPTPSSIPPSLAPTPLQSSTPHDIWIDLLPHAALRDNLILLAGTYDHEDLCCDMMGGLFEGYNDLEMRGILVWSDPWHPSGWEFTEGFLKKWGFLLKGHGELLEATNNWRATRDEEPLVIEVQ